MSELWELAAAGVALVIVGAVLSAPDVPNEQRAGVLAAVVGAMLLMARIGRHRPS